MLKSVGAFCMIVKTADCSFAALILITADNTVTSGTTLQQLHFLVAPATQPRYQGARSWPGWCWARSGVGWYLQQHGQHGHHHLASY